MYYFFKVVVKLLNACKCYYKNNAHILTNQI